MKEFEKGLMLTAGVNVRRVGGKKIAFDFSTQKPLCELKENGDLIYLEGFFNLPIARASRLLAFLLANRNLWAEELEDEQV